MDKITVSSKGRRGRPTIGIQYARIGAYLRAKFVGVPYFSGYLSSKHCDAPLGCQTATDGKQTLHLFSTENPTVKYSTNYLASLTLPYVFCESQISQ